MNIIKKLSVVSLLLFACSCAPPFEDDGSLESSVAGTNKDELALAIHAEVNRYRASLGKAPLKLHSGLGRMAQTHSNFMRKNAGKFEVSGEKNLSSHYGLGGRKDYAAKTYGINSLNENVIASYDMGQGTDLAAKMVRGWVRTPSYKHNMEMAWDLTGIGVAFDDKGRVFVTQIFGSVPSQSLSVGGPAKWTL